MLAGRTVVGMQQHQSWLCEIRRAALMRSRKQSNFPNKRSLTLSLSALAREGSNYKQATRQFGLGTVKNLQTEENFCKVLSSMI